LRKGELASLTISQLELDGDVPYLVLDPADEKNRKGSNIPVRADLVHELRRWVNDLLANTQAQARKLMFTHISGRL
jgi:hypothetical protein